MKIKLNIQKKLVVLLLVFGLLPVLGVMPIVFEKLDEMEESRLQGMQNRTSAIAETIDRNLFERYGDVQAFGVNAATKDTSNWYGKDSDNSLISAMNSYMTNYGLYKVMMLVDTEGKVAAVNTVNNKGKELPTAYLYDVNFKDASWFKKAMNKEFLKSDVLDGTVVEQPKYDANVAKVYGEDGFTINFAAPVYDVNGNIMAVWVNFADFGLIEDIAKDFYAQAKTKGEATNAFAIQMTDGTALLDYDPTASGTEDYKRDTSAIGIKKLVELEIPAAEASLKTPGGTMLYQHHEDLDGAAWTLSDGAMGYPGLGWIIINHQPTEGLFADIVSTKQLLVTIMIIAAIAIAVVGLIVGTLAARPIKKLALDINNLAEGDYTKDLDGANRSDEIGDMVKSLNNNVRKVREIVTSIKNAANSVNSASSEIAAGSSDLSMRTEQQASSLEETAASMEEITGTVKQNSANATSASNLSGTASRTAEEGGKVVEEAVSAMSSIEKSSQKISDIIGVIDEIAFQTNLLALNAAVEAARAGDAGKGFAVVASEVRALAGRSASASKEIKTLINESAGQVQAGSELVNKAGETLKGIVSSVKQVASIVSEIASASVEQAAGIDQINSAVTQMDEATQQNAALVEENTAAAQSMLEQAKSLEDMISFFKVEEHTTEHPELIVKPAAHKQAVKTAKPVVKKTSVNGTSHHAKTSKTIVNGSLHADGWEQF